MDDERPIGWWVKRLDTLLEEALDSVVAGEGLTRRHWQVLHLLAGGGDQQAHGVAAHAYSPGAPSAVCTGLTGRGWVVRPRAGLLQLTGDGVAAQDCVSRAV